MSTALRLPIDWTETAVEASHGVAETNTLLTVISAPKITGDWPFPQRIGRL